MTRKDYQLIADAVRKAMTADHGWDTRPICRTARDIADALASDNPRFDRARFLAACGVPE